MNCSTTLIGKPSENATPGFSARLDGELVFICAVFLVVGAIAVTWYPVNHDVAWFLHVAGSWLDGARLYVDVIEVNPPLIIMLLTPVVAVADLLDTWVVSVFYVSVLCLSAVSLWVASRILLRMVAREPAAFLIVGMAVIYMFLPRIEFGQREHLMLLFTMPYFFSVAAHGTAPQPSREALLTGTLAGLGFALKPHFLLVLIACEVYLIVSRRKWTIWRAEFGAIGAVGLAYAVALVFFTPSYFEVARWASRLYGAAIPSSWRLIASEPGVVLVGMTLIGALATQRWSGARIRLVFAIAAAVFLVTVFIQNKNFDYHWLPVYGTSGIVWTSLAIEVVRKGAARIGFERLTHMASLRRLLLALVSAAVISVGLVTGQASSVEAWSRLAGYSNILSVIEAEDGALSWFALSANLLTAFPLVTYTDLKWGAPFPSLWPLIGLYDQTPPLTQEFPYRAREDMGTAERYMFDATLRAMLRDKPSLILVDGNPPGNKLYGFDFLEYFAADERFTNFMKNYVVIAELGQFRIYRHEGNRPDP